MCTALVENETLIRDRHRQERKQLQAQVMGLKRSAAAGGKKAQKAAQAEIRQLELAMAQRHEQELKLCSAAQAAPEQGGLPSEGPAKPEDASMGTELDPAALLAAAMEDATLSSETPAPQQAAQRRHKPNRQKARLARREQERAALREQAAREAKEQPDLRAAEIEAIAAMARALRLQEHQINADGHCLYSAFADQLHVRKQKEYTYLQLRKLAADYIRAHADEFTPFIAAEGSDVDSYTATLESSAEWGGELEILALARALQLNIKVLQQNSPDYKVQGSEKHADPDIFLSYYRHLYGLGAHYNSLRAAAE